MKVAHLTTVDMSLRYLVLPQLLAVLRDDGEAIGISAPGEWVAELEQLGVRHIPLHSSTRGVDLVSDVKAAVELWSVLRREKPDVLHTHNPKPGVYGRIVGRLCGVPIVVNTVHGLYATTKSPLPKRLAVYLLEAIASRFSDAELIQNPEDLDLLIRWRITPRGRTRLLGNGVDLTRFMPPDGGAREAVRRELDIADEALVVGIVGRLVAEKGYRELIDVAARLGGEFVVLCIGGRDSDKPDSLTEIEIRRAESLGVRFLGHRSDTDRLYAAMDIFVLPSHREGFPRAAMEAAACGLPVIASDIRGCRQVVEDGVNGILVDAGDVEQLREAIQKLGRDEGLRNRMGRAGCEKARSEFDERRVVETVMETYEAASRARRRGWPRPGGRPVQRGLKRLLDVLVSAAGLVVLSPVMVCVGLAVRMTMGSPILYRQERPGQRGEPFTIVKFRTMRDAVDDHGQLLPDEDRLTPVGRFLRKSSLDELPELFNVLRGEMSVVGPRPLLMHYLELYDPVQLRRHEMPPGLTGWAQVNGRNASGWQERLANDVWYVQNWSFGLDIRILFKTLGMVVSGKGVSQPGRATVDYFEGNEEV